MECHVCVFFFFPITCFLFDRSFFSFLRYKKTPANTHVGAMLLGLFPLKETIRISCDQWMVPATINPNRNYSMAKTNPRFRQPAWTFLERKQGKKTDPNLPFFLLISSSKRSSFYFFLPQTKPSKLLTLSLFLADLTCLRKDRTWPSKQPVAQKLDQLMAETFSLSIRFPSNFFSLRWTHFPKQATFLFKLREAQRWNSRSG